MTYSPSHPADLYGSFAASTSFGPFRRLIREVIVPNGAVFAGLLGCFEIVLAGLILAEGTAMVVGLAAGLVFLLLIAGIPTRRPMGLAPGGPRGSDSAPGLRAAQRADRQDQDAVALGRGDNQKIALRAAERPAYLVADLVALFNLIADDVLLAGMSGGGS